MFWRHVRLLTFQYLSTSHSTTTDAKYVLQREISQYIHPGVFKSQRRLIHHRLLAQGGVQEG